jgi:hypothetical protein
MKKYQFMMNGVIFTVNSMSRENAVLRMNQSIPSLSQVMNCNVGYVGSIEVEISREFSEKDIIGVMDL